MPYPYSFPHVNPGDQITASGTNAMHQAHVDNNIPTSIDDYSSGAAQMREVVSPGDDGTETYASDLAGEITRLRHEVLWIKQQLATTAPAYWYSKRSLDKNLLRDGTLAMTGKLRAKSGASGPLNPNNCGVVFTADNDTGLFNPVDGELRLAVDGEDFIGLLIATRTVSLYKGRLQFPSVPNLSSDANTLDDYEEGTWTPQFLRTITNPTVTYDYQSGKYIKIGHLVFVTFILRTSSITSQGSGSLLVGDLPFTPIFEPATGSRGSYKISSTPSGRDTTYFMTSTSYSYPTKIIFTDGNGAVGSQSILNSTAYSGGVIYITDV